MVHNNAPHTNRIQRHISAPSRIRPFPSRCRRHQAEVRRASASQRPPTLWQPAEGQVASPKPRQSAEGRVASPKPRRSAEGRAASPKPRRSVVQMAVELPLQLRQRRRHRSGVRRRQHEVMDSRHQREMEPAERHLSQTIEYLRNSSGSTITRGLHVIDKINSKALLPPAVRHRAYCHGEGGWHRRV